MTAGLHMDLRPYSPPAPDAYLSAADKFHPVINGSESLEISEKMGLTIQRAKDMVSQRERIRDESTTIPGRDVGIIALGTGGTLPSKYRNGWFLRFYDVYLEHLMIILKTVLSTLVRIPKWGNILLDVGEGTWGQMARNYGLDHDLPYSAWQALRDLKCIFVSHVHADHHLGLASILAKRKMVCLVSLDACTLSLLHPF